MLDRGPYRAGSLRDASADLVESARKDLGLVLYRRCRHIVTEKERVVALVHALDTDDRAENGELMARSHANLRDDHEVSEPELGATVVAAVIFTGLVGGRLIDAGFGSRAANIVERSKANEFASEVAIRYRAAMAAEATIYVREGPDGAASGKLN